MGQQLPDPVTQNHLAAFGLIVHEFARFERLVEMAIAHTLGSDVTHTAIVLAGLGYLAKCDALCALVRVAMQDADATEISAQVDRFNEYSSLRNLVAHHVWKAGKREESIKPLKVASRGGKVKFTGLDDAERDYTVDDLFEITCILQRRYEESLSTLVQIGAVA